ncbi:sphingosine 1-phosphate receptor 1-like [Anneissia japonica]|uniref:sphingosine 1-phosphate receptor 1-like n=1 Tax=Anneissia japonica TaxID=1529436 RepID=UPI0014255736|nr:sphingosine 1-phosphate receptor 1-like [Anneissia japonica]
MNCSVEPVEGMDSDIFASTTGATIFTVYFFFMCICSIIENTIILVTIILVKRLHKRRHILIFNLALTDLMAGFIYPCSVIYNKNYTESMSFIVGISSVFTIFAIATERFLKIVVFTKSRNAHIGTTRQLVGVSAAAWMIPFVILLPIIIYDYNLHLLVFLIFEPVCIFVVMAGISVLYLAIYVKIRSHEKRMSTNLNRSENYNLTKLVLKAYVVLVAVYAVCWLPWAIECIRITYTTFFKIDEEESTCIGSTTLLFYIGVGMSLLNSALNPIIYWLRLPDFREGISELFECCKKGYRPICCFKRAPVVENSGSQNTTSSNLTR